MSQINFPNSPSDGDQFVAGNGTTYQYDSATAQWKIIEGPGALGPSGPTGATGATSVVPGPPGPAGTDSNLPTAMIMPFGGSTPPTGWLECDGQSTSGYTDLAAIVGANVPDLRGEFLRGWDNGKGTDTGRALLSAQSDDFKSHNHPFNSYTGGGGNLGGHDGSAYNGKPNTSSRGGSETRPRNIAVMYCIKT